MIRTGLDRVLDRPEELAGRRVGLLAHAASVTLGLEPAHLALQRAAPSALRLLIGPEHGFYAVEQDMVPAEGGRDPWTGLPVLSLYRSDAESLKPESGIFDELDLLLIDLQDVGCRYYTYAATAAWAAESALGAGREVWVLDRPNPLGGESVEGNLRQPGFDSFVGAFSLPVRHGLTLGELMTMVGRRRGWPEGLRVILMEGWERRMTWGEVGRPWLAPSPNLPCLDSVWVYPGVCLLEATTLSEGRGTTRPFLLTGAPGVDPPALVRELTGRASEGLALVPGYFRPQFHKHRGEVCGGVRLVVTDRRRLRPYRFGVELLMAFHRLLPGGVEWRREPYEFVSGRAAIDLLTGDSALRLALERGESPQKWVDSWGDDEAAFLEERRSVLLYPEATS